jgi:hypothetical protein
MKSVIVLVRWERMRHPVTFTELILGAEIRVRPLRRPPAITIRLAVTCL